MSRESEPLHPAVDALLSHERAILPQGEARRRRALARARAALAEAAVSHARSSIFRRLIGGRWLAAIAIGVAAAVSWAAIRESRTEPPAIPASLEPIPPLPALAASMAEPPTDISREAPRPTTAPANSTRHVAPSMGPAPSSRRRERSGGYEAELRLLEPARAALARGDFTSALAALAEHKRQFPAGKLAEEREALRIKALLGVGDGDEARASAAAFRKAFPTSVLLPRVEDVLRGAP